MWKTLKAWLEAMVMVFLMASIFIIPIYAAFRLAEWLFQ